MKKLIALLLALLLCTCAAMAEEEFNFSEDSETAYVETYEEAAALYGGEVPAVTAPEGFALTGIMVDDFGLTAYYAAETAAEDETPASYEFSMYDFGKEEGVTHYSMTGGVLAPTEASMVSLYEEDGMIYSADVFTVKGAIYFYFDGLDRAQVEAVLAGLQF